MLRRMLRVYRSVRKFFLAGIFLLLAAGIGSVRNEAARMRPHAELPDYDYLPTIQAMVAEGKIADALTLCDALTECPDMPHAEEIEAIHQELREKYHGLLASTRRFLSGFFSGSLESIEEMAGTVVSDFLIYGDLRDLYLQGRARWKGEETDPLIAALSAAGLASSIASFIPATSAAAAPADGGIALTKGLKRAGALTPKLAAELQMLAKTSAKTGNAGKLGDAMVDMLGVAKHAPAGMMSKMMRQVETVEDLTVLRHWTSATPRLTAACLQVGGEGFLKQMAKASLNGGKEWLIKLLRKGPSGFKALTLGKSAGKIGRKKGLKGIQEILAREWISRPEWWKISAWLMYGLGGLAVLQIVSGTMAWMPHEKTKAPVE